MLRESRRRRTSHDHFRSLRRQFLCAEPAGAVAHPAAQKGPPPFDQRREHARRKRSQCARFIEPDGRVGAQSRYQGVMDSGRTGPVSFRVRTAEPADVPALMRLKRLLARDENSLHAVRASAEDWLRDGFGPLAGFTAFVAELTQANAVVGMATCSRRTITGWSGPVIFLQDLYVEADHRKRGI